LGVARQFKKLHALINVGLLCRFVPVDLALQVLLLPPPLASEAVEKVAADSVEPVDVRGVGARAEAGSLP